MFQEIYVIDEHVELTEELKEKFIEHGNLKFKRISANDIQSILKNLPQLIIINDDTINIDSIELCKQIRTNEDNNIIPIIVTTVLFLFSLRFLIVNLLSKFIIIPPQQFFHLQF